MAGPNNNWKMSFLLRYYTIVVIINPTIIDAAYDSQPKVHTKNDELILEAAYDHNISLRLSPDSSLLLNDIDIMDKIYQHQQTSTTVDTDEIHDSKVPSTEKIKVEVNQLQAEIQRFYHRMLTPSQSSQQMGKLRQYIGRLRRITGRISELEQNIAKDECTTESCKNGGTCYDSYKAYHCDCTEGWTGKTCEEDVDECYLLAGTDLGCQNNAVCTNTAGGYKCACAKGFTGTHCRLSNPICQQHQSEELCGHGICVPANNQQGYTCICNQGWRRNTTVEASLACEIDVNECEESINPCHRECINLPGSFKCGACPVGYTGNGLTCFDIDECAVNNGGCSLLPKVRCINTEGSYRCGNCPPGWIGDGHSCDPAPSNSCNLEKICHPQAKCEYISDIATCTCMHGMFGHGFGPRGCHTTPITDSCEKHICQNNGTCLSTGRRTSCLCPNGYSGALCESVDGCHPNPCENGGTCKPHPNQLYKCSCSRGTTGKRCEVIRSVCASTQRRPSGELTYPTDGASEYAPQEGCAWIIRTLPNEILNLTFTSFDVEEDPECGRDWLQIHDGNSLASQLIGRFCGKDLPLGGNILSSQHQLFFWFRSDNATNKPGFHMTWESQDYVCGGTKDLGIGDERVIRSPGYPGRTNANKECQWELLAPYGHRFVIRIYDINMGSRNNCTTGDSLKIYDADLLIQEYCQTTSPEQVRSSSNKLKLHFHTDPFGSDSSFQLHYEVQPAMPHCGGVFTEMSGVIIGPTEQSICLYLIKQPSDTQIKLEFIEMSDVEEEKCRLKSIEVFDSNSDQDSQLLIFCGGKIPEPVMSTSNYMLVRYNNKLQRGDLTTPFKAKYTRVCEFRFFGPDAGIFTTPNYPYPYTQQITCTFQIYGPPQTVVHANFTDFFIAETKPNDVLDSDENVAASNAETAMANSLDESLTYFDVYLSDTNKRRFNKAAPMELISELNRMTIVFHATSKNPIKSPGIRVQYSFEEILCGGVYTENNGTFEKYVTDELECKCIFEAPEGKSISLSFNLVQLTDKEQFLMYGKVTGGKDILLKNITNTLELRIKESFNFNTITIFASRHCYWNNGEYAFVHTSEVCGGNFSSLYGIVKTPNWPRPYGADLDCVWIINAPLGKKLELKVQNFTLEPTSVGDVLEIRNGKYATAPLIGRYGGSEIPSSIPSFANSLYLRFTSDNSFEGPGFHITWEQTETGCGGKLTSYSGSIHAPHLGEDVRYQTIVTCYWLIHVAQGSSVALSVTPSMDALEFCRHSRLQIYDGSSALKPLLHLNCSEVLSKDGQLKLSSSSNQVLIVYTPLKGISNTNNNPEFILDYETNCNMVLDHVQGVIESPNFPDPYPESLNCNWDIKAGSNNKIKLAFSHLSLEADSQECQYDYVEVWDMKNSDVLTKYHLCSGVPQPTTSEGNHLRIRFVTDYSNSKNGFRAEYVRVGCGEYLTEEIGKFSAPIYPNSANLDCDWYIEVAAGKQIVFEVTLFRIEEDQTDCTLDALIVKEFKNANTSLLRICSTEQMPSKLVSPFNRLYIHYQTGPSIRARYFTAEYSTRDASCGGSFSGSSGILTSPNYPYNTTQNINCKWYINVPYTNGILLNFKDFELSEAGNCSATFLKLSKISGNTEIFLNKYCGRERPMIKMVHGRRMAIEYIGKGFQSWGRFSLEYRKQCGGMIVADSGYLLSNANEECVWWFDVPEENIFDEDITTGNYTKYMCMDHPSSLVFEVSMLHIFANNINFRAQFSTIQHSCGGIITSPRGSLASPYYPASYPANVECTWDILAKAGNRLQLQFDEMDIAPSEHCNQDYLEVRTQQHKKVLGLYCGSQLPDAMLTSLNILWIRFHSSEGSTGKGFKLKWSYAHLNEIVNATKGYIECPPLEMVRTEEESFAWRILIERGKFVTLHFTRYSHGLNLYDGYDDTALPVSILPPPWRFVSSSNVVYLKADNDNLNLFFIQWNTTSNKPIDNNTTTSQCHTENSIKPQGSVMLSSPNYPLGYKPNLHCDWIYKPARPIDHIVCEFYEVKLEVADRCSADYVKISTSTDLVQWHEVDKLCNSTDKTNIPFRSYHGTPNLKLDFVSDSIVNRTGFTTRISTKCGSYLTQSVGFIEGEQLLYERNCLWHIAVKPSRRILLQLDYPPVMPNTNNICWEYAIIYDGLDEHAPIMPPGKICNSQNVSQIIMNSSTNYLTVKYNLSLPRPLMPKRWNLTFREYSECNEEYRLIPEASTIDIKSPNYPNIPQPHTECEWRIVAPPGELIQVEFIERFDMNPRFCNKEFVELFDGSTMLARSLGQHCQKPGILKTSQNVLYMHYLTDINEPRSGFKARVSISKCGASYTAITGVIVSPGYPNLGAYPSLTQCDYVISLTGNSEMQLHTEDIDLPFNNSQLEKSDYLEIISMVKAGTSEQKPIVIYGNTTKRMQFILNVNKAIVRFHSFSKDSQYRGFKLSYNALSGECVESITGESGYLNLHYSREHHRACRWEITVPKGQRVRLELLNMGDLKEPTYTGHTPLGYSRIQSNFNYPLVSIYNDRAMISTMTSFNVNTFDPTTIIQSTDNYMMISIYVPYNSIIFKTLRARYSADDESPCPPNIDEDNNAGLIDIRDTQPMFNDTYCCMINIKLNRRETLVFNITKFENTLSPYIYPTNCHMSFGDGTMIDNYRENVSQVLQPHSHAQGYVRIVQTQDLHIRRLTMGYRIHKCGGFYEEISGFSAEQPDISDINYGAIMCVWTLSRPVDSEYSYAEYHLSGNFTFSDSCDREFIVIKEGKWKDREPIKKICRDNGETIEGYIPKNLQTYIAYQSEIYNSQKTKFSIHPVKSITCASETLVGRKETFIEVLKESYKNNYECAWIFYTSPGCYLQVHFYGRFFIETSPNCSKDYLEMQQYKDGLWIPDARYCGRELPPDYNSSTSRIQIVFRTNEAVTGDGFSFVVRKHCPITFNVTSTVQRILNPAQDNDDTRCEYIFQSNEGAKIILVKMTSSYGQPSESIEACKSTITVYRLDESGALQARQRHCENEFEERAYKYLKITCDIANIESYTIEYSLDTCGGNITTSPTTIRHLKHAFSTQYAHNMNCVWLVTAPADHSIVVRFKYFDMEYKYDHVSIYTGHQIQSDKRVIHLTGNQTLDPPIVLVDHNQAVINAISDVSRSSRGFEAQIIFSPDCNERITLTDGNSPVYLARNHQFTEGEEKMCLYRLNAPDGYRIRVNIKNMQINNANSTCAESCGNDVCNRVEVFDSAAMNHISMGKYCLSRNISLISSYSDAQLTFIGQQSGQYSFEIILTMEKSACGTTATEHTLEEAKSFNLTFPQRDKLTYDPNLHCNWHFRANFSFVLHFSYIDLQNASQVTGKCLDYVQVKYENNFNRFCGHAANYSMSVDLGTQSKVDISFHSDASTEGKGFELTFEQYNQCNQTRSHLSGRIRHRGYIGKNCNITILVPENYNLNFYISGVIFYPGNKNTFLRIIDLNTNKTLLDCQRDKFEMFDVFTTTNAVRLEMANIYTMILDYAVSDRHATPGCGGNWQALEAYISSPHYGEQNDHNYSECRWNITVPAPNRIQLHFNLFDMGSVINCHLDNVKIIEIMPDGLEKLLKTLCGPQGPSNVIVTSNRVAIVSRKSPNFDGTGWHLIYILHPYNFPN